jgi:pimeloyl-ACP methyl ester carboxylesterase
MTTDTLALRTPTTAEPRWLDPTLYPFAAHSIELEGQRLHYIDEGTGEPVLFVHGTPSWSFEWREQVKALREHHRCIAVDHLGFGLSDKPQQAAYKPEDHARRLAQLVRALDLRSVTLVVHDFGGPIGVGAALLEPERFARLVVVNTWLWSLAEQPAVRRISRFVRSIFGRFLYLLLNFSPRVILPASFAMKQRLTRNVHRHYLAPFATRRERTAPWVLGCELAGSGSFYESLWQQRERWPRLAAIVWGMRDPALNTQLLLQLEAAFPQARVTRIADAGHFPQEEAPELVTAALREVLL